MSETLRSEYIQEPDLVFGGQKEEKDPRIGLRYHGPYHYTAEKEPSPNKVKVGIIGSKITFSLAKQFLEKLKEPIPSKSTNKWLYPDFPGFQLNTSIKCDFVTSENWEAGLKDSEIKEVLAITDNVNRRIGAGVNLFRDKVHIISMEDDKPDVIICALPLDIEEYCGISEKTRGAKRPKFTPMEILRSELRSKGQTFLEQWGIAVEDEKKEDEEDIGLDFRNGLKGKIMEFGIPIQILRESTARDFIYYGTPSAKTEREPATFAWNLATALYYKANGKPWRLAKLRQDTCYVGISFFHNLRNPDQDVQTSMAQVFTHNGEGIVLRGNDVVIDSRTREPHMSEKQSRELLIEALKIYKKRAGREPSRVEVHKTTLFSDEEKAGFNTAIGKLARDFVTVNSRHSFRFARMGQYPVLRGTLIYLSENESLLYTSGYIPRVKTYPGARIPQPLLITHYGDSETNEVCKEIMGLTKLNWNTTAFATYLPITLEFSQKVGKILSELPEGKLLQNHYRFYM
jgi:hypothetical protein